MPRISTKSLRIQEGDLDERIEIIVYYHTDWGFYAQIPEHLNEAFDQLNDKELKALKASRKYNRRHAMSTEPHKRIVSSPTEDGIVQAMEKLAKKLLTTQVEKIPVIIVTFENKTSEEEADRINLPNVGMVLEVTYCFQVSTGGSKPKYYTYEERDWMGEKETVRSEVSLNGWYEKNVVIPDTPDNRKFVEDLHAALKILVNKMVEFTATPENMLKLIDSRQKLLSL